ncbi:hypothetical protein Tco_0914656 [Tanacetum coccineum]
MCIFIWNICQQDVALATTVRVGDDCPPTHHITTVAWGCFSNRGQKKNPFGWRKAAGCIPVGDPKPRELIREMPLHYPSWRQVPAEQKAGLVTKIGVNMMMRLFRSDDKFSQMLTQFESSPEFEGSSGSGGCGDDESGGDEDDGEDEEDGDS